MSIGAINPANYLRRRIFSALMDGLCSLAALTGLVLLALILLTLVQKGMEGMSLNVFIHEMRSTPGKGGGLANAIVGSFIQTGIGALIGAPLGVAVGVYLAEVGQNGRFAAIVRFINDILLSAPSILIGLFVYEILVVPHAPFIRGGFSGLAGGVALALLAMPVVARTTEDIIKLVPHAYREGSIALGARESATILKVVLPAAFGGILTGILLAVARISGETAPLIFTSFGSFYWSSDIVHGPMASLPLTIYRYAAGVYDEHHRLAWAGALIITVAVLLLNIVSRASHYLLSKR
jgi:phosphate transport system permease protein